MSSYANVQNAEFIAPAEQQQESENDILKRELKKNIEQQVDVVLKMEEERLLLLKESKEVKDKNKNLTFENEEFRSKISIFESELEELQDQIRNQQHEIKDKVSREQQQ